MYRQWIAAQPSGSNELHAAWFNLGVSLSKADDKTNAIVAYQNALLLRPDFYPAAANLGTLLESIGQTDAALRIWERALQPNEVRLILINNRARLLEHIGRLDEAERETAVQPGDRPAAAGCRAALDAHTAEDVRMADHRGPMLRV